MFACLVGTPPAALLLLCAVFILGKMFASVAYSLARCTPPRRHEALAAADRSSTNAPVFANDLWLSPPERLGTGMPSPGEQVNAATELAA
jgi:hypothetical protein